MAAKKFVHRVCGAAAVLRRADRSEAYLYKGAVIPEGFTDESIAHNVALGLVEKHEVVDPAQAAAEAAARAEAAVKEAEAKAEAAAAAEAEKAKAAAAAKK